MRQEPGSFRNISAHTPLKLSHDTSRILCGQKTLFLFCTHPFQIPAKPRLYWITFQFLPSFSGIQEITSFWPAFISSKTDPTARARLLYKSHCRYTPIWPHLEKLPLYPTLKRPAPISPSQKNPASVSTFHSLHTSPFTTGRSEPTNRIHVTSPPSNHCSRPPFITRVNGYRVTLPHFSSDQQTNQTHICLPVKK